MRTVIQCDAVVCDLCGEEEVLRDGEWVRVCEVCGADMCSICLYEARRIDGKLTCPKCLALA